MEKLIRSIHPPEVLGHGDLKPGNIMVTEPAANDATATECLYLIDFELSGMNYRGFDICKIFRTANPSKYTKRNIRAFVEEYLVESSTLEGGLLTKDDVSLVIREAALFEPMTVSEYSIFYVRFWALIMALSELIQCRLWFSMSSGWRQGYSLFMLHAVPPIIVTQKNGSSWHLIE